MGRLLSWILSSVLFLLVAAFVAVASLILDLSADLPDHTRLADYSPPVTTRLYAGDGQLMAQYATENRLFVPIEAIPDHVVQAFVSAEDQHFYEHPGIDITGIARAALTNIENYGTGRRPEGASTITQQVAKNFLLTNEVSYVRKLREILLALRIESIMTKDEILELYLNDIYLGYNSHGVAAAALNYFGRSLPELTLAQAAYLAALPKAPNDYHPIHDRDAAIARRNYVIGRMLEDGAITEEEAADAIAEPFEVAEPTRTRRYNADYFSEEVRRTLQDLYGDNALYGGGLSVRTTLDPRLQDIAERSLRDGLIAYDRRHGWRGPVARLETFDNWADQVGAVAPPLGSHPWRLAVVLDVAPEAVLVGLADGSRGLIPFDDMSWARPAGENQSVGPQPRQAGDVLSLGDVVLVEALGPMPRRSGEADGGDGTDGTEEAPPMMRFGLRQVPAIQGALVVIDPHTGRVLALSGGYSFEMSEFNRATQAARQPGSAFKPFVYLAALEAGYTPSTVVLDSPLSIPIDNGRQVWTPSNYAGDFLGPTPLRVGLERSRNIMTVRLLLSIGLTRVRDIANEFGIYDDMPLHYSMALGAGEVTPLDLTAAYAMLANGGRRIVPTLIDRIQDRNGTTVYRHDYRLCDGCSTVRWIGGAVTPHRIVYLRIQWST